MILLAHSPTLSYLPSPRPDLSLGSARPHLASSFASLALPLRQPSHHHFWNCSSPHYCIAAVDLISSTLRQVSLLGERSSPSRFARRFQLTLCFPHRLHRIAFISSLCLLYFRHCCVKTASSSVTRRGRSGSLRYSLTQLAHRFGCHLTLLSPSSCLPLPVFPLQQVFVAGHWRLACSAHSRPSSTRCAGVSLMSLSASPHPHAMLLLTPHFSLPSIPSTQPPSPLGALSPRRPLLDAPMAYLRQGGHPLRAFCGGNKTSETLDY